MTLTRFLVFMGLVVLAGTRGDVLAQEKNGPLTTIIMATSSAHTLTIQHQNSTLATLEVPAGVTLGMSSEKPAIYAMHDTKTISEVIASGDLDISLSRLGGPKVVDVAQYI